MVEVWAYWEITPRLQVFKYACIYFKYLIIWARVPTMWWMRIHFKVIKVKLLIFTSFVLKIYQFLKKYIVGLYWNWKLSCTDCLIQLLLLIYALTSLKCKLSYGQLKIWAAGQKKYLHRNTCIYVYNALFPQFKQDHFARNFEDGKWHNSLVLFGLKIYFLKEVPMNSMYQ